MTNAKLAQIVYFSFYFIALGVFVSVTVPSVYHIIAFVPLVLFSWKYLVKEGNSLPKSSWALLAYALVGYLTSIINFETLDNPMRSFGKQKYELFAVMTVMGLYYMRDYMTVLRWRRILNVFLFTIVAAGIYSAFQVLSGGEARAAGFTETMRYGYGTSFALSMMLACVPFLSKATIFNKRWFWSALVLGLIGIYFAKTRGAILGLFVSLPFIIWFFKRKLSYVLFGVGAVGIGALLFVIQSSNIENRLFSKLGSGSNLKRLSQYEASLKAFSEKPILGHGVNQFSSLCPEIKKKYDIYWPNYCEKHEFLNCSYPGAESYCGHSHNVFLEIMANRGLLGLFAFCAFLVLWAWEMWRRQDAMTVAIFGLLTNFIVASQFEYTLMANTSFMLFFIYSASFFPLPAWCQAPFGRGVR